MKISEFSHGNCFVDHHSMSSKRNYPTRTFQNTFLASWVDIYVKKTITLCETIVPCHQMKDQSRPKLTADQSTAFSTRSLTMSRQVFVSSFVNKDMINLKQRSKSQKDHFLVWNEAREEGRQRRAENRQKGGYLIFGISFEDSDYGIRILY